jgi:hypothetical protein
MTASRSLLERAAKAAGLTLEWQRDVLRASDDGKVWELWNPLERDGDALRLAVKLGMSLGFVLETGGMMHWGPVTFTQARQQVDALQRGFSGPMEDHGQDPYAATRLAIVRAAASMVKENE